MTTLSTHWGLPRDTWKALARNKDKIKYAPYAGDTPEACAFGEDYWHNYYPNETISYKYNSWGVRGEDYDQYRGKKVNICVGDSFTVNVGGPVEHSWPALLSQKYSIPTLNIGLIGLNFYEFSTMVEKAKSLCDVQHVFVLHNLFDKAELKKSMIVPQVDISNKILILKNFLLIKNSISAFAPPWVWEKEDLPVLYSHFPNAHDYLKLVDFIPPVSLDFFIEAKNIQGKYLSIAGPSWPPYEFFCQTYLTNKNELPSFYPVADKDLIQDYFQYIDHFYNMKYLGNRTVSYASLNLNKKIAEYFFNESLKDYRTASMLK